MSGELCSAVLSVPFPVLQALRILLLCGPLLLWIPPYHSLFSFVHFCFFWGNFDESCAVCLSGLPFRSGISKLSFGICVVIAVTSGAINFDVDSSSLFSNAFCQLLGFFT